MSRLTKDTLHAADVWLVIWGAVLATTLIH